MRATIAIFCVFLGCCTNVVFLELLVKDDPGSGNLITFAQFLFIAIEGFLFTHKCGTVKPNIGIKDYFVLVTMFFVANVCNNYAFDFNIPMPLHMIFRAGSLIANMIMGIIILKKMYAFSKYLSVFMITSGIAICTIVSGKEIKSLRQKNADQVPTTPLEDLFWWSLGISLLTIALFVSARMGIYQETLHKRYGKNAREALYYTHLLPLPFFLTLAPNIYDHWKFALASESLKLPLLGLHMPSLVAYLIGNILTQYMCISSVFVLTTECSSLTVTLVITLRKFLSLLFSIVYFKNPFTIYHWIGTLLVFVGTIIFTEVVPKITESLRSVSKTKKTE
ncbi:UDP-xylose and UDP-N-acetylglucosamine transporter-like isoform X2 [Pseudomyrmex gracilis]|nr:UDP-xylose and UDP-N-acetylglucosamine transporter-like isoform X2 [Pseudomyrmex gracilis]XP_020283978.1 UDP-xylose and UDP-N-acetylglucosamine transporter-like isoform X2 [Pseudomyrmex gracilis]XP_020283979.1 UDP-xylose and UDP-N-acetylglucosamine transporter-like isoform X2 [Pseudomyrmex gracilis]XP_020283980.1 UDP-xylose and UDP-N-acetylglucosamine transporter-like isoform X2 [Pseudomyrmex gracilis]XP_020283981.1 UDP-xylose and UDP-N-acetylglucosamine transporter-like isoform X2 [Pseudomy